MNVLMQALALVLAFSPRDYAQINQGPYTLLVSHGTYWSPCDYDHPASLVWLAETDFRCHYITLSEKMDQPALAAALIVGETRRSEFDPNVTPDYDIEFAGITEAKQFEQWFEKTYGPPVFADPNQAEQWRYTLVGDTSQNAARGAAAAHS